jgi:hypothetical protein
MQTLSSHDLLDVWEWGQAQSSNRRALGLLAVAFPGVPARSLEAVRVGRRDRALLAVREAVFGRSMRSLADCPVCRASVELDLDTAQLRGGHDSDPLPEPEPPSLRIDGVEIRWRPPDALDLIAMESATSVEEARERLLRRTVLEARRGDSLLDPACLPDHVIAAVAAAMEQADPEARIEFALSCPDCDQPWVATFDPAAFLWREIETLARRLLAEVHALASAYGWREADILGMGQRRRWTYLEMLSR